jgi:tellurite resistance protein
MAWHLEPNALHALRDMLVDRGVPSLRPGKPLIMGSSEAESLLERVSPFLELLYLMMIIDDKCDERERRLLRGVTRTLGGADLPGATVDQLLAVFDAHVQAEGVEGRLDSVASWLSADRLDAEAAFTLTAAMAVADGDMGQPEHGLLSQVAGMLSISPRRAQELLDQSPLSVRTRPAP